MLLGPSGAGKTSLLRVIAGLEMPQSGELDLGGRDLLAVPAQERKIALLFQDDSLFPHMTLGENLEFAAGRAQRERIEQIARALEIEEHLHNRPAQLSGGERGRAALARAALSEPLVLLLDEPLAHLDPQLRSRVRAAFTAFMRAWNGVVIVVTHDHEEAIASADRLGVLMKGRIVALGPPREVYERPATLEVARFFGMPPMNLLNDPMHIIGIRAEHVRLDDAAPLRGAIRSLEQLGADALITATTPAGEIVARLRWSDSLPSPGQIAGFAYDERSVSRFDRATGARIA